MLNSAWIIPAIPAVSFVLILFFGKRTAEQGRPDRHHRRRRVLRALVRRGRPVDPARRGRHAVTPRGSRRSGAACSAPRAAATPKPSSRRSCTRSRGGRTAASSSASAPRIDGLAVMMLFVVTLISLLVHIYSIGVHARRRPLHALLRDAEPVHRVDAAARRRRQHAAAARRLGARRPLLVRAHRALVGGEAPTPTPRSRPSSPPAPATSA